MAAPERQHGALQTIFSFFLGLMVVAFVGVGVNTFYPGPNEKYRRSMQELSRRQESLDRKKAPGTFTPSESASLDSLRLQMDALQDKQQTEMKDWAKVTSIILVLFATLVLATSLLLAEQLRVISNGLLLGGLFTMIYGVGWVIFSGNSVARFWVITLALIVSIGLGYLKFVSRRRERRAPTDSGSSLHPPEEAPPGQVNPAALAEISARVRALEERAEAAAAALGGRK